MRQLIYHQPKLLKNASDFFSIHKKIVSKPGSRKESEAAPKQKSPFVYTNPIFKTKKYDLW